MQSPYSSAVSLTSIFMDYCALHAFRISIAQFSPEERRKIKKNLIDIWKKDTRDIFENQRLYFKDGVKQVAAADRLQYLNALDELEKKYFADEKLAEQTVVKLLEYEPEENKIIITGG